MQIVRVLKFAGLETGVSVSVDQPFLDALKIVFPNWPYQLLAGAETAVFAKVVYANRRYEVASPHMEEPKFFDDPVNAICCLIVELAWARLRSDPSLLCLHGAAVEIAGRLLVFPSSRKTGKSTLSVALLAAGYRLYTDDFLPLKISDGNGIMGVSHGISPRLRLPLPDQLGGGAKSYIAGRPALSNRQYHYLSPAESDLAHFGQSAPVGALVFLERSAGARATVQNIDPSTALKSLITQNFSRAMNAAAILQTLAAIVKMTPAVVLRYDDVGDAVNLIAAEFGDWKNEPARLSAHKHDLSAAPQARPLKIVNGWEGADLIQARGVKDIEIGTDRFLAAPNGRNIHHLNSSAAVIWQLLKSPLTPPDTIDIVASLFPEIPKSRIEKDIWTTLKAFVANGLVCAASPVTTQAADPGLIPVSEMVRVSNG